MKKVIALFISLALILGLCACAKNPSTWQEQYDLGIRYLSEDNYQDAIIAFTAAIEIDPKRAEAYVGLADVYTAQGNTEQTRRVLEDALTVVSDPSTILNRLNRLEETTTPDSFWEMTPETAPGSAPEASPEPSSMTWTWDGNGTLTISGSGPMDDYNVLPDFKSVPWSEYLPKITKVVIEDGITSIGDYAFSDCSNLESVNIPDGVTVIKQRAFLRCTNLQSVSIPYGVESIEEEAFLACENLKSVTIPDSVTSMGYGAFAICEAMTEVNLPDGIDCINNEVFWSCGNLTSVTIPDSVTRIGSNAFIYCDGLTSVTIPDGVTSIEYQAFFRCLNLESVTIPTSVTSIGDYAFSNCINLTHIYYDGTAEQWERIDIGDGSEELDYAYQNSH